MLWVAKELWISFRYLTFWDVSKYYKVHSLWMCIQGMSISGFLVKLHIILAQSREQDAQGLYLVLYFFLDVFIEHNMN